ncbi:MAG: ATP-binding protein [Treponema sp.]|nr:ATP-binding protein [Treponema sp.]
MRRQQEELIRADLDRKMVFLSGPRQVGKSWLARELMKGFARPRYLNYDSSLDREVITSQGWASATDLLVLDELHKMPGWKGYLKGLVDTRPEHTRILVTGSARLETFRQSGDSLAGRYVHHRLFPITPAEAAWASQSRNLEHYLTRGGFPEPYLAVSDDEAGRWRRQYVDGLIREDILNFENITKLKAMNLLLELLRDRVASPLSYQSLSEDIGVAPNTIKSYLEVLEALYIIFRVTPYHRSIARSLQQRPKVYFFDTGLVRGDDGKKIENLVALSLLRAQVLAEDRDGKPRSLRYLRTKDGREVDFLTVVDQSPRLMVEVKASDRTLSPGLRYFHEHYGFAGVQLVGDLQQENEGAPLRLRRALDWLESPDVD